MTGRRAAVARGARLKPSARFACLNLSARFARLRLSARFARRELRSGIRGFRIFLACLALGVAALAASGSTATAFRRGLAAQSRAILGGDIAASVEGRRFTAAERRDFERLGRVTDALHVRAMAEGPAGDRRLAEVRGVDAAFPLAGTVTLDGAASLAGALSPVGGVPGAAVDPHLLDRLHLGLGDIVRIGDRRFVARARLDAEPDTLGRGFALGGAILVARSVLDASGLIEPGDLFGDTTRIALRPGEPLAAALHDLAPEAANGVRIRDRRDAAGGLRTVIDQVEFFLGFIGLASLLAGGLGVSTAVAAYLDTRRNSIAILKTLGAAGATVRDVYLIQVGVLAGLGVAIGLVAGAATPFLLGALAGGSLPVPVLFAVYPLPLAEAALFGLLVATAFGLGPLAVARATPPASLFRHDGPVALRLSVERVGQAAAALALAGLAVATAPTFPVAGAMIAAIAASFALLLGIGRAAAAAASRARVFARGAVRLGLANLGGRGSAARVATPAIGLGVALLASLMLVQGSILDAVRDAAPRAAPTLILTGIPASGGAAVDAVMRSAMGAPLSPDRYRRTPFATGRIVRIGGAAIDPRRIRRGVRWAFDHDIGVTTLAAPPPDADLSSGRWWPAGYRGPPAVIVARTVADGAGLAVGDRITLAVLGREIDARIAALRPVEFGRFGASFPLILDPAALAGAHLREIAIARTTAAADDTIVRALGRTLPDVTVISVREQLRAVARIFGQLAAATSGAAAVTSLAGILVLVGAIASTSRARARDAAILKVLGASRAQILAVTVVEYGAVGAIAATAGVILGLAAAWPVATLVLHTPWHPDAGALLGLLGGAILICTASGLVGAATAIARPPSPVLRAG